MLLPGIALALVLVHAFVASRFGDAAPLAPQLLLIAVQSIALAAAATRARGSVGSARTLWWLLASAVLMKMGWGAVNALATLTGTSGDTDGLLVTLAVVTASLYVIPCTYLIASTFGSREPRGVIVLDVLLSMILAALLALLIFRVLAGATMGGLPASTVMIRHADAIDFSLAALVTLRLFGAGSQSRRYFYFAAAAFLWINASVAAVYNRLELLGLPWWGGLLIDVPFLALVLVATRAPPQWLRRYQPPRRLGPVVAAFAPIAMALGILLLGLSVSRLSFLPGAVAAVAAAVLYGLRVAVVQADYQAWRRRADDDHLRLQRQLQTDGLTGIANRSALDARLRSLLDGRGACALLMIDIDYFKQFNDSQGHGAGDACLVRVAQCLADSLPRAGDLVARYGGEEFAVLLPDTTQAPATEIAARLLQAVAALDIVHPDSPFDRVTVSIGIAAQPAGGQPSGHARATPGDLMDAADLAMYRAKADGRNRCAAAPHHGRHLDAVRPSN